LIFSALMSASAVHHFRDVAPRTRKVAVAKRLWFMALEALGMTTVSLTPSGKQPRIARCMSPCRFGLFFAVNIKTGSGHIVKQDRPFVGVKFVPSPRHRDRFDVGFQAGFAIATAADIEGLSLGFISSMTAEIGCLSELNRWIVCCEGDTIQIWFLKQFEQ
jgi:hypothetical protein